LPLGTGVTTAEMCIAAQRLSQPLILYLQKRAPKSKKTLCGAFAVATHFRYVSEVARASYTAADRDGVTCAFCHSLRSLPCPAVIVVCDETFQQWFPSGGKSIASRGAKQCARKTDGNTKKGSTILLSVSGMSFHITKFF